MTLRCKPGDMAVFEQPNSVNFGLIVKVIEKHDEASQRFGKHVWRVRCAWPALVVMGENAGKYKADGGMFDRWLRPIRPPETPVTETRDHEVTA
jgi:hypothetical protein